jgi:putative peptidoglycan lipid II flippase
MKAPDTPPRVNLFSGLRVVSLCTLLSRVLGLVRDIGMAALFGNGAVMDAFSVAFRVPNLARRLFGEGALTAAFLPVFIRQIEQDGRPSAWRLASAVLTVLAGSLALLVLLGELLIWGLVQSFDLSGDARLLLGLTAVMLPYAILICLAAQVGSVLHALGHFTWPALLPILLNAGWIACLWWIVPALSTSVQQVYAVAACVTTMGVLQLAAPLPTLHRLGFRFDSAWRESKPQVSEITRAMLPVLFGLSVTQLNTICDSLIAWGFSPSETGGPAALPFGLSYPLTVGTASALFFGQRMFQFPLGVFGVALGTVMFPLLSRHAGRGEFGRLRDDLTLGLRLVVCIGVPASAGLMLLAHPLTVLFFQRGAFGPDETLQTAAMISTYGVAVWAYCALLIVQRGYYALGDRQTPLRIGLLMVLLNLWLNLTLIWPIGGRGLALSTSLCAVIQVAVLTGLLQRRLARFDWSSLRRTILRTLIATSAMSLVCAGSLEYFQAEGAKFGRLVTALVPLGLSLVTYFAAAKLLGLNELWLLFQRDVRDDASMND